MQAQETYNQKVDSILIDTHSIRSSVWQFVLICLTIFFGFYLTNLYNFLLFHTIAEIFSIVVAFGIFIIVWNSRRYIDNAYILLIGIAYLFIAGLDLLHTLSYNGMGVFKGYNANLPTQLWIAARYLECLSILAASFCIDRKLKANILFFIYAAIYSLVLLFIFHWQIFPDCFIEGTGLTPFKKVSEYIISLILAATVVVLWKKRSKFEGHIFRLMVLSIILTIGAELTFTLYESVYGISNLIGHYFKVISFYFLYKAFVEIGINRPYDLLFRNLKQSNDALYEVHDGLEQKVHERTRKLAKTLDSLRESEEKFSKIFQASLNCISIVKMPEFIFIDVNESFERTFGYSKDELIGKTSTEIKLWKNLEDRNKIIQQYHSNRYLDNTEFEFTTKSGKTIIINCTLRLINIDGVEYSIAIGNDITERKKLESKLMENHKDLQKLAGRLILNQEEEFRRLARELHDDLTQQLAVMAIDAGNIEQQKDVPESVLQQVKHIKEQLIITSKNVHNMSRAIHPSIIEDLGLERAIKSECSIFSSRMGVAVMFTPKNLPDTIPNNIALTIYRVIQEGLLNIAKHAEIKNAYVFLEGDDDTLQLTIHDTGAGFDPTRVRQKPALGLGSMRERARLVNGTFKIISKPGKGTNIELIIPLKEDVLK